MKGKCFDMGTIQAFLDGETSPAISLQLTTHVADCHRCARMMAEAEDENSVVFATLGRELDTLVPTQRLWLRINESIEGERTRMSAWQKFLVYITATFANPSLAAAAAVLLAIGMFAILWMPGDSGPDNIVRVTVPTQTETVDVMTGDPVPSRATTETVTPSEGYQVTISNHSPAKLRRMVTSADLRSPAQAPSVIPASADAYLPGEESYVKTIADLKDNVDQQKDRVLTPSTRVSYERDMAVVNDSINKMRDVVRKNPRSHAARQVLYASYQDKIDLLSSVAQREELMASLR